MVQDMDLVRSWARRYYDLGMNPLPSRGDSKRPALKRFKHFLHGQWIPEDWLDRWWAQNIQIPLGVPWRLCVVDIDGRAGLEEWSRMISDGPDEDSSVHTWYSFTNWYSKGIHVWFRLPYSIHFFQTATLWSGGKHEEIRILGDGAMAVVPPSIHPERGTRYQWLDGPDDFAEPAMIPEWLLSLHASALVPQEKPSSPRPPIVGLPLGPRFERNYQRDEVLYGLGDRKHEIAALYGLEHRKHPNTSGFYECRSIDREDQRWSCTIHPVTGVYKDWATGTVLSFFDLLMRLDPATFPDFSETVNRLGSFLFGGQPCPRKSSQKSTSKSLLTNSSSQTRPKT